MTSHNQDILEKTRKDTRTKCWIITGLKETARNLIKYVKTFEEKKFTRLEKLENKIYIRFRLIYRNYFENSTWLTL